MKMTDFGGDGRFVEMLLTTMLIRNNTNEIVLLRKA